MCVPGCQKNGGRWLPNITRPGWKQTEAHRVEPSHTHLGDFGVVFPLRYWPTSFGMSNASVACVNRNVYFFCSVHMISSIDFLIYVWIFWVVSWATTPRTKSEIHPHIYWWGQHALAETHFARTNQDESLEWVMWCYLFLACCLHCNFGLRYLFPCAPKHPPWLAVALHKAKAMSGYDKISGWLWSDVVWSLMIHFNNHALCFCALCFCAMRRLYTMKYRVERQRSLAWMGLMRVCVCVCASWILLYSACHKLPPFCLCGVLIFW